MILLLRKKLSHLLPCAAAGITPLPSHSHSHSHHLLRALLPYSTPATQDPSLQPHFMAEYLVDSLGFSPARAAQVSRHLTHLKSPSKPDAVLHFLRRSGFTDAHIRNLLSARPRLLCAKVEKTLEPKLTALREAGFSGQQLVQLASQNPGAAFSVRDAKPKIDFWRTLFNTNDDLLRAIRYDYLLTCSLEDKILPNVSLMRERGIPDGHIAKIVMQNPMFITRSRDSIEAIIQRARRLGIPQAPGMLFYLLHAISNLSGARLDAKIDLLKHFGWSEDEVLSAVRRTPYVLKLSDKKARMAMEFFTKEARCKPSYLADHPVLLLYNLDRRVVPRYRVLKTLARKKLIKKDFSLSHAMAVSEKKFVEKFIAPFDKKIEKLYAKYSVASACKAAVST